MGSGHRLGCVGVDVYLVLLQPLSGHSLIHACLRVLTDTDSFCKFSGAIVIHLSFAGLVLSR